MNEMLKAYRERHLRELQLRELEILKAIDVVCRRNNIPYWLDSGTLLGAVRHGGFIPWDDDVDICMPKAEIPRFVQVAQRELPEDFFVQTPGTDPTVRTPYPKVRDRRSLFVEPTEDFKQPYQKGVYVDVFPVTDYPAISPRIIRKLARGYGRAHSVLNLQHYYSLRSVAELFYFGAKRALFGLIWRAALLIFGKGSRCGTTINCSWFGNMHLSRTVYPLGTINFEGIPFPAPADCDTYLKDLFGDYMQLPPENQRHTHAVYFTTDLT